MGRNHSKLADEWFASARDTLRFTKAGFRETRILSAACYGSQQAAEKALKALLATYGQRPPRIHDISALLSLCQKQNGSLSALAEDARLLSRYVVRARYPTELGQEFAADEGPAALAAAQRIVDAVERRIEAARHETP